MARMWGTGIIMSAVLRHDTIPSAKPGASVYFNYLTSSPEVRATTLTTTMADAIPAKLKSLQLAPFAKRAAQLEKYKPIVTYWCKY